MGKQPLHGSLNPWRAKSLDLFCSRDQLLDEFVGTPPRGARVPVLVEEPYVFTEEIHKEVRMGRSRPELASWEEEGVPDGDMRRRWHLARRRFTRIQSMPCLSYFNKQPERVGVQHQSVERPEYKFLVGRTGPAHTRQGNTSASAWGYSMMLQLG